jgi:L-malate glycosyltransferase
MMYSIKTGMADIVRFSTFSTVCCEDIKSQFDIQRSILLIFIVLGRNIGWNLKSWYRMYRIIYRFSLRMIMAVYLSMLYILDHLIPSGKHTPKNGFDILLTGTFYSKNWIDSHLYPLAQSKYCTSVKIVTIFPIEESDKIKVIYPSKLLRKVIGNVPARMLTFLWVGIRCRPAFVGGFHLLLNGLAAALLARLIQARSIYFCVGGPAEVMGGGITSGNRLFEKLKTPNAFIEQQLIKATKYFSIIITMGTKAVTFFQEHSIQSDFQVVSGGIDSKRFSPTDRQPDIDLIMVGRLEPIKRFDIFIKSVAEIKKRNPAVKATIIGDGSLAIELKRLTKDLELEENILFPGAQSNVEEWLRRSKIFMLTSDSEGLSLAVMEAMMCGLPAVVSNVGDLGDLVKDGKNGFLITKRSPLVFSTAVLNLLSSPDRLQAFSKHARKSAMQFSQEEIISRWNTILEKHAQVNLDNPREND